MLIDIQGRKIELTPTLKEYALEKVSVINKYLDLNMRIHVTLSVDKFRQRAEVAVNGKGVHLHGVEETEDMYASIDKVMDKIVRQAKKVKEKRKDYTRTKELPDVEYEPPVPEGPKIVKADLLAAKPISTEEAVEQLGHNNMQFIVYRSAPDERVSILYHRSDGNLGLIET